MHRATVSPPPAIDAFCATGTSPTRGLDTARRCRLSYEIVGPQDAPLIVVLGGISASRHVTASAADPSPGWWQQQVGDQGQPVDTRRVRVLSFDFIGGPGDRIDASVTTDHQADALADLLDRLGELAVALLVGASYGGMVALSFAARHPTRVRRLVSFGAAHRTHPMATALRSLQRRIVRLGLETGRADDALAIARGLAMTTYRSVAEFERRFASGHLPDERPCVESYLEARGRSFARGFCPYAFLRLSESIDRHRVDPATIPVAATLVSFETDTVVPPWLVRELATGLAGPASTHHLASDHGHDAFLTDTGSVAAVLRAEIARVSR